MNPLAKMLASIGDEDESPTNPILPEAAVMQLREVFDAYAASIPFKPGDLVTVRSNADIKGDGVPHIVLEVNPDAEPTYDGGGGVGANGYGKRLTMRVATFVDGVISPYWVEHWQFEPYELPTT
jgi:hypothetical protein